MTRPTAVDLSRLDAPQVVETLSFEAIYAAFKADFLARWAERRAADPDLPAIDVLDLDTDPLAVAFQTAAFRELLLRARVNDAARSVLIAYAIGADLDHLAALMGVERLQVRAATDSAAAVMETDARLRRRVQLAPEAYGAAGSEGAYVYHALTAAPELADATAVQVAPGEVTVTLLGAEAAAPPAASIERVRAALTGERVRPLTDTVAVLPPVVRTAAIDATLTLYPGPSASAVITESRARLDAWIAANRQLGRDLPRAAIVAQLYVDGVQSVQLVQPAADVTAVATDIVEVSAVAVAFGGRAE